MLNYNGKLKQLARNLRSNMTEEETIIWVHIRNRQIKDTIFYRQKVIGNYIVDFYSSKAGLIIEIDGGEHYSNEYVRKDKQRDLFLKKMFSHDEFYPRIELFCTPSVYRLLPAVTRSYDRRISGLCPPADIS